jgi:hypothetical protein
MPVWITALGVVCIGVVGGYLVFYSYKRLHPPISTHPLPLVEVIALLTAVGASGVVGGAFGKLDGVNYIGPYGIGLFIGVAINVALTIRDELAASRQTALQPTPTAFNSSQSETTHDASTTGNRQRRTN